MSKTILIVEDDRSLARLWSTLLSSEGFQVLTEKDGDWAIRTATSRPIDFLLLDVLIPVKNGFQVAETLRANDKTKDLPILMVSGIYRSGRHRSEALKKYALVDYLDKPLRNKALIDCLKGFFGKAYPSARAAKQERSRLEKAPDQSFANRESKLEAEEVEESSVYDFKGRSVGRGDLRERPFPGLIAELYRWRATGALLLKRGRAKKIVYLKSGYPISVKSNLLSECLGKVMVRERMITEAQCDESLELMRMSGRQQGTVLIEMGLISPHNLVFGLELQLLTKLKEVFAWRSGTYQFTAREDLPAQTVSLDLSPSALIWQGVNERWNGDRARSVLGAVEDSFLVPSRDPLYRYQEMDLGPDEERFLAHVNGHRSVRDLLESAILPEEQTWKLVYALAAAQIAELRGQALRRSEHVPSLQAGPPPLPAAGGGFEVPPVLPISSPETGARAKRSAASPLALPPSVPNEGGGDEDQRAQKERLAKKLKQLRSQDYFAALGVSRNAGTAEVRKAYFALARSYHPDKIAVATSDELKGLAAEIYERLTHAYEVLADSQERNLYEAELAKGSAKADLSDQVSRILAAEGKFQRGEGYLRKGKWELARDAFAEATRLYPEEGEFHAFLGWSLFQTSPADPAVIDQAIEHIMEAVNLNPRVDKAYLFLGYIYKAGGRGDKAEKQFEKAIQVNPDSTEALRELRLFQHHAH